MGSTRLRGFKNVKNLKPENFKNNISSKLNCQSKFLVWFRKTALLDHLILILDQEFDTLNWSGGGLGDTGGNTRKEEILDKVQLASHVSDLSKIIAFYDVISTDTLAHNETVHLSKTRYSMSPVSFQQAGGVLSNSTVIHSRDIDSPRRDNLRY